MKRKSTAPKRAKSSASNRWIGGGLLALFILLLDQGSKYLVHLYIPPMVHEAQWYPYNGIGLFENLFGVEFSLVHATNTGAAWGLFSDFQNYLVAFRVVFITVLFLYLVRYNKNPALKIPLTLIIAGAIGNIVDYVVYGHVIDMFHFVFWNHHYPVFNIADSAICAGVGLIILMALFNQKTLSDESFFSK